MLEVIDYSGRRGAMVPLLTKIHVLLTENAERDTLAGFAKPENIIFWKQKMGKELVEVSKRFMLASDGNTIAGLMFYQIKNGAVYINQLQIAWQYRKNPTVLEMLLSKFAGNKDVKECDKVFAGENIKAPVNRELLASVGFKETFPEGWEPLGSVSEAAAALKIRV